MYGSENLIIFTRFPVAGAAKTRLIPALGAEGAAQLQREMTEHTVRQARKTGAEIEIRFTGGTEDQMRDWLGDDLLYADQGEGDLGERMTRAFQEHFDSGAERAVIIGCDCPSNHWKNMRRGFQWLEKNDCVIGPASDGGYYLIGLTRPMPGLFQGLEWGAETVLEQTLALAPEKPHLLKTLHDIDLPEDIPPKISVIIPTLNEAEHISQTLENVNEGFNVECIVADGGSTDHTRALATAAHAIVIENTTGRAIQMNLGARAASGDLLFFLHADSYLPAEWDVHVRRLMASPSVVLGFFRFAINEPFAGRKWVEWGTNIRSHLFKRPYGDQGLFLRKNDFWGMDGYPEIPILEDVMLIKKAKKKGFIRCTNVSLETSGRRWKKMGFIKTILINQAVLLAAMCGADLHRWNRIYQRGATFLNSRTDGNYQNKIIKS